MPVTVLRVVTFTAGTVSTGAVTIIVLFITLLYVAACIGIPLCCTFTPAVYGDTASIDSPLPSIVAVTSTLFSMISLYDESASPIPTPKSDIIDISLFTIVFSSPTNNSIPHE